MEIYKITFLKDALYDLEEIILYIASDSREGALKWHSMLMNKIDKLSTFPKWVLLYPIKKYPD
ncbi:hypothetical protein HZF24_02075 [Sedimentibacter hydroxybenzoicus DSM 7310]|uniref:Type II toxin-antitoxin system RelE/ParE family toxin n=1 Tax=Sedimentibacter hydroxybenzoicus DSM 7310 TaxID=1123245 RepID=A0A974GV44_SEDHY|nr:hypothetical protein [Sedimentibacter hydroxybenzoicus]NYB72924.1 hypothetical protein [Sedimentibacter hydroxybenzoicus DSM 7310]